MPLITDTLSDVQQKYELLELLGTGGFGSVYKCRNKTTGELAACKSIAKYKVDDIAQLSREIAILRQVHHPHIIELYDVYEDKENIHLVTELCTGGELYDKLLEKAESEEGHFSEDDAAIMVRDVLDAIRYCHDEAKIVHRDLKPENFLLANESDQAPLKIIDFGLSRRDDAPCGIMSSRVGTPYYVAPEVLTNEYTYKIDLWSIGIVAYILLCGFAPFSGDNDLETLQLVQTAQLDFPSPEWDAISDSAKDFIRRLLRREPLERPTAAEALKHPWIAKYDVPPGVPKPRPFAPERVTSSSINLKDTSVDIFVQSQRRTAFQKFLAGIKLKKAMNVVVDVLTPEEARHLGDVFRRVDQDKDGIIQLKDLDQATSSENSFSTSLRHHLKEMRSILAKNPRMPFDIKPFIVFTDRKGQSA